MGWPKKTSNSNITALRPHDELSTLHTTKLKLDLAEKKLKELEEALGEANARNDELEIQLREENKQRRCLLKQLEKTSEEIQGTLSNLNAELESEKSCSMSSLQTLSEAKNTEQILKDSNASNTSLAKTLERFEKRISDQDKEAISLLDAAEEISYSKDKELSSLQEKMSSAIHNLTSAIHYVTTHQDELSQAYSNLQSTEKELAHAKQNYLKLIIDHHNLKSHLDDMHQEYGLKIKQSINVAKLELQELYSAKFETMKKQMVEMYEEGHQKRDTLFASLKEEVDNLKREQSNGNIELNHTVDEQKIRKKAPPRPVSGPDLFRSNTQNHITNFTQAELPGLGRVPVSLQLSPMSDVNQGHPSRSGTWKIVSAWGVLQEDDGQETPFMESCKAMAADAGKGRPCF